jgi:hypothetical protein
MLLVLLREHLVRQQTKQALQQQQLQLQRVALQARPRRLVALLLV